MEFGLSVFFYKECMRDTISEMCWLLLVEDDIQISLKLTLSITSVTNESISFNDFLLNLLIKSSLKSF